MTEILPIMVHSLVGAKQVDVALKGFQTLLAAVPRPMSLTFHDDGTLVPAARERLVTAFGAACTFVDRSEAGVEVSERLRQHPRCLRFRQEHLFGPKLFDVPLLGKGRTVYSDGDILWTRRGDCADFFVGTAAAPFVVMRDIQESYAVCMRKWPLLVRHGVRLASRFCAGMMSFDRAAHDLDYIEWLLGLDERFGLFGGFRFWAEQTIYAALAARAGCAWIEPGQCVVANTTAYARQRNATIIHFAGFARPLLEERFASLELSAFHEQVPLSLPSVPTPVCGLARRLVSALRVRTILRQAIPA